MKEFAFFRTTLAAVFVAGAILVPLLPANAADTSASCGALAPKPTGATDQDMRLAQLTLDARCAREAAITPNAVAYGDYLRLEALVPVQDCVCDGNQYRAWTVNASATGVPYDGNIDHLNSITVIWRINTTGLWQVVPARPVDTYGSIPTISGTMSTTDRVYAESNVFDYTETSVDLAAISAGG